MSDRLQEVITVIEQLGRAVDELKTDHPINNRIALVLIDNATELLLHRECVAFLSADEFEGNLWRLSQSQFRSRTQDPQEDHSKVLEEYALTSRQRRKARGRFLKGKLQFLAEKQHISETERRFIDIAHGYRNELYHAGLARESIIRSIACVHFRLCCNLLARQTAPRIFMLTVPSSKAYPIYAEKYLPVGDRSSREGGSLEILHSARDKLLNALPGDLPELQSALSEYALEVIDGVAEDFKWLVENNLAGYDAAHMLRIVQMEKDLDDKLAENDVVGFWHDEAFQRQYQNVAKELMGDWKAKYTSIPLARWRNRAIRLGKEANPLVAADLYQGLQDDIDYLKEATESAAMELDKTIQHLEDQRRGK